MSTKADRGECDARGCHQRATERVASFYPGDEALRFCNYHAVDEKNRQQSAQISTYGKAQKWVDTGRALQHDPCAMGYLGHMMDGAPPMIKYGQPSYPTQYYTPGQRMPQQHQQQITQYYTPAQCAPTPADAGFGGHAAFGPFGAPFGGPQCARVPMATPIAGHGAPAAFGGMAASAPIPIPRAQYAFF